MYIGQPFEDFIRELVGLASPSNFEAYVKLLAEDDSVNPTISDDRKRIKYSMFNTRTGKYDEYDEEIGQGIYDNTRYYIDNAPSNIISQINGNNDIDRYLNMLRSAIIEIEKHDYFIKYPYYKKSLIDLGNKLNELKKIINKPLSRSINTIEQGDKKQLVNKLKQYFLLINNSDTHEEAIQKIKEIYPSFEWTDPQHELFTHGGKLKGSRASEALEQIAKMEFGEDKAPKAETIRAHYFKQL